ncbi:MAG: penicillin-binding transpeptidase domain-containing protein [Chlamydiia bacterium]
MRHRQPPQPLHALFVFGLIFALSFSRIAYLALFQHENYLALSRGPRELSIHIEPDRGTIRDRHNRPLATNRIAYDIGITFDKIALLPRAKIKNGIKTYPRKEYIEELARFLTEKLDLDRQEIEDLIFSKSALFPNTFFPLKQGVEEKVFYLLKMEEKNWPGLDVRMRCKRQYPMGPVGLNLIGRIGPIQPAQIGLIQHEAESLKTFFRQRAEGIACPLPWGFFSVQKAEERFLEIQKLGYRLNSFVGRGGVEEIHDHYLRGTPGKERFEVDVKGRFLRKLPESIETLPGKRLLLTIDALLQKKAEELLIINEKERDEQFALQGKDHSRIAAPFIKGGAIIAMDPKTSEILAMASYPRIHPDMEAEQWLESKDHILEIFDGQKSLMKERINPKTLETYFDTISLPYEMYINQILSADSAIKKSLLKINTVGKMLFLQQALQNLLVHFEQTSMQTLLDGLYNTDTKEIQFCIPEDLALEKQFLDPLFCKIGHPKDRLLLYDLCHLFVPLENFSDPLKIALTDEPIEQFVALCQQIRRLELDVKKRTRTLFKKEYMPIFRRNYFPSFLTKIRKNGGKLPYLDYLKPAEEEFFQTFYERHRSTLISSALLGANICPMHDPKHRVCEELSRIPIVSNVQRRLQDFPAHLIPGLIHVIRSSKTLDMKERTLATAFYPKHGFGYSRSYAYQESAPLGSIFKIVSGYTGLKRHLENERDFTKAFDPNPLTIRDEGPRGDPSDPKNILGYLKDGTPITRMFRGGRLPRSDHAVQKCDLERAIEQSSNIYFSLLTEGASEEILQASKAMGLGSKTGVDLPLEIGGTLPFDLSYNKTGLYAYAIGQHLLTVTPLQVANLLGALVTEGQLKKPHVTKALLGAYTPKQTNSKRFEQYLQPLHMEPALFSETFNSSLAPFILPIETQTVSAFAFPRELSYPLLSGLHKVLNGERGGARPEAIRYYFKHPDKKKDYNRLRPHMIGKSATAQISYRPFLDKEGDSVLVKHIWFALVHYDENSPLFENPDLVVVVYLRFGDYGKEALPLAVEMVKTFLELKKK